jgi:hypothetical protein
MATSRAQTATTERRAHMRWSPPSHDLAIKLRVAGAAHPCRLRDISAGGAALIAAMPVDINAGVTVELSDSLHLSGFVYRTRNDGIVVKFDLAPEMIRQVDQGIQLGLAPAEW